MLVGSWILGLTVGTGLAIHPVLGTSVTTSDGASPRDFISAMYAGGSSIALVGTSDKPHYSVSRFSVVCLDTVTLINTALEDRRTGWLRESIAVAQLWEGSLEPVRALTSTFLWKSPDLDVRVDERTEARWRRRYVAATERLRARWDP